MPRHAARVDGNHQELVDALRRCGWQVEDTHRLAGFVDAVIYKPGWGCFVVEFKSHAKAKYTKSQQRLIAAGWPLLTFTSVEDVIAWTQQGSA